MIDPSGLICFTFTHAERQIYKSALYTATLNGYIACVHWQ